MRLLKLLKKLPLCVGVFLLCWNVSMAAEDSVQEMLALEVALPNASLREKLVGKRVFEILFSSHYQKYKITPQISAQWYENYFKFLDFNKMFFLESDLEEFRSYETILWDSRTRTVNLDFAFAVYRRFLERVRQWAQFSVNCIKQTPDFTRKEYLPLDEENAPWQKTMPELQELWRLRIKNLLLLEKLQQQKRENGETPAAEEETPTWLDDNFIDRQAKNIARNYKRRLEYEPIQILEIFMSSLAQLFDPHSAYMAPDTKDNFDIDMSLSLQGIGATLSSIGPYTVVVNVISGGPADKDGQLKEGDRIIAVAQDGKEPVDVVDLPLNLVVGQIRGAKNTVVHLTILPEGSSTRQQISITRDEIKLKDQEAQADTRLLDLPEAEKARILVLYLPSFYSDFSARSRKEEDYTSSSRDILKQLKKAQEEGPLGGVILDLRGNGGGSLDEAVQLSGIFLNGGPVVQVKYYRGQIEKLLDQDQTAAYNGPLIVLVDKFSASASEIVAACLQDTGRALVLGDKSTHGKGTVQTVFDLERDGQIRSAASILHQQPTGSLKFTIGKFYRINGSSTQVKGVIPDIIFPAFSDYMEVGEARLPHVMPWDEISPARYTSASNGNQKAVTKQELQEFAQDYMAKSSAFGEYLENLKFYAALREKKLLPLEIMERADYQKMENEAATMYRKFHAERKNSRRGRVKKTPETSDNGNDAAELQGQDIILDAALAVMGKML